MPDAHLEADFPAPEYTTPQGTQEHGVDHGHEERDVNFRALFNWFGGLALFTIISVALLWITNDLYVGQVRAQEEAEARQTPLLYNPQAPPPQPWLLPNPVDTKIRMVQKHEVMMGPWDLAAEEHEREDAELKKLGLQNEQGLPVVPANLASQVIAENAGAAKRPDGGVTGAGPAGSTADDGPRYVMPSYSSGGTLMENQLR